jgi:voltage-dependent calcium channel alpha-2/delta-3
VPFDAGNRNDSLVTGSHALFHKENGKSAPVAVVGFQFQLSAMFTLFKNITSNCVDPACTSCASDDYECFVLDENGYVIVAPDLADAGRFFGDVRGLLMHHLFSEMIYQKIVIYDYQAICFVGKDAFSMANKILTVNFHFYHPLF